MIGARIASGLLIAAVGCRGRRLRPCDGASDQPDTPPRLRNTLPRP